MTSPGCGVSKFDRGFVAEVATLREDKGETELLRVRLRLKKTATSDP